MSNNLRENKVYENIHQERKDEISNNMYLNQLLTKNRDGSIPLFNFMKNTESFIRKYEYLSHRVQEIENKLGIENSEKPSNLKMKPLSYYFPPVNLVENKKSGLSEVDNQLLQNLEFMEKQSQQVKELLSEKS